MCVFRFLQALQSLRLEFSVNYSWLKFQKFPSHIINNMSSNKFLLLFVLVCVSYSQDNRLIRKDPPQECHDHVHWVLGLDRSGSMGWGSPNTRWQELTDLVNGDEDDSGILDDFLGDHLSAYMFTDEIIEFPGEVEHEPVPASLPLEDQNPNGGTSFHQAVTKAAAIMDDYPNDHTCFYLITDGESSFSQNTINKFTRAKNKIEKNCEFCARCYFIQEKVDKSLPKSFENLCKRMGAEIVTSTANGFRKAFLKDAESHAAAFRDSIRN